MITLHPEYITKVLHRVKVKKRNALHAIKRSKANWLGHILHTIFIFKHIIEGKIGGIKVMERKGRKQLLDNRKKTRGCWKLKENTFSHSLCKTSFGRRYGPVLMCGISVVFKLKIWKMISQIHKTTYTK
jgi:hypothetical protein